MKLCFNHAKAPARHAAAVAVRAAYSLSTHWDLVGVDSTIFRRGMLVALWAVLSSALSDGLWSLAPGERVAISAIFRSNGNFYAVALECCRRVTGPKASGRRER
jgi:hypothetical protein